MKLSLFADFRIYRDIPEISENMLRSIAGLLKASEIYILKG